MTLLSEKVSIHQKVPFLKECLLSISPISGMSVSGSSWMSND